MASLRVQIPEEIEDTKIPFYSKLNKEKILTPPIFSDFIALKLVLKIHKRATVPVLSTVGPRWHPSFCFPLFDTFMNLSLRSRKWHDHANYASVDNERGAWALRGGAPFFFSF